MSDKYHKCLKCGKPFPKPSSHPFCLSCYQINQEEKKKRRTYELKDVASFRLEK